jgi:hypothetical protein
MSWPPKHRGALGLIGLLPLLASLPPELLDQIRASKDKEAERRERLTRRYGGREIGTWDGEHTREYDTPAAAAEAARLYRGRVICGGRDTRVAYRV